MNPARILIVEDEAIVREDLRDRLEALGYAVAGTAATGREAVAAAERLRPDLVLMDIQLREDMDGIAAAERIRATLTLPVVFLTAFADERTIARAAAARPYGYLTKPLNNRAVRAALEVALHRHREEHRPPGRLAEEAAPAADDGSFHGLYGASPAMHALFAEVDQLAAATTTVFIGGETGTGKERVARALHAASPRAGRPFLAVNCAGLPETLAASELFGHRRGAFTGAAQDRKGVFEAAEGGTILLDEIGDVPRSQQAILLRVLEEREVLRVGESVPRRINVRMLAASNRRLEDEVAAGRFRSDLFYRIHVARIVVPPLRERAGDAVLLGRLFLERFGRQHHHRPLSLGDDAAEALRAYPWPGNVRELKNAMEFAALRSSADTIRALDLPPEIIAAAPIGGAPLSPEDERARFAAALQRAQGSRTEAARLLGISRATYYRRLGELGLASPER